MWDLHRPSWVCLCRPIAVRVYAASHPPARGFSLRHRVGSGLIALIGFVYVFSNPGLSAYKVGMTTRALRLRADELQREYGTVYPFEIASRHAVDDPAAVEALAHRILDCPSRKSHLIKKSLT